MHRLEFLVAREVWPCGRSVTLGLGFEGVALVYSSSAKYAAKLYNTIMDQTSETERKPQSKCFLSLEFPRSLRLFTHQQLPVPASTCAFGKVGYLTVLKDLDLS